MTNGHQHGASAEALFAGPGEVRAICRAIDWSATPLGPVAGWPQSLRAAVRICLDAPLPMAVWAGSDHTLIYNEAYRPVLGPARHPRALGRAGPDAWPELWDRFGPELQRLLEQGGSVQHEDARFLLRRGADEEEAFFTYTQTPIREEDGRIVGALDVLGESTERVRSTFQRGRRRLAEEQLRESEERYRTLVEVFPEAVLVHQFGRVVFANPAALRLFGASAGEAMVGVDILELTHPEARTIARERIRAAQAGGRTPWREVRMRRLDGAEVLCEVSGEGIEYRHGPAVQVVMRDITERRRAEEALRVSEQRLRAHMDNSPLAIVEFDSEFRVKRWSQQAERVFGWSADEVLGRAIGEMHWVYEEDQEAVARESAGLRTGERARSVHVNRNYRKDGSIVHCEWYSSALYGSDGSLVSVLSQVLDVTARKQAEQGLLEAKARLEEVDRNKNRFLALLSHELRNPLAPIRNSLYVLERAAPGGAQASRAREIVARQIDHMIRLVDDLLDVTRIVSGKIRLRRQRLDLNELARGTIEDNRSLFIDGDVELELRTATDPVWICGDRIRLAQVIGNLLANAVKFTSRGGTTIVSVLVDKGRGEAILSVRDTGHGMAPEMISRLFEPFTQADTTMDRSQGGLGLGLALVKGLVEEHGGSVAASSDGPGRGSEFTIRLSLDLTEPVEVPSEVSRPAKVRWRVLIIEDSVDAADSLREFLELEGHDVAVAYDGPQGIAMARELHPDVVLCDIGLPGMDGYRVARAFRGDEALRNVHLVALTGYALAEDLQRAADAGFDQHLAKPPSLEKLEGVLGTLPGR